MCFVIHHKCPKPRIAKKDIVCYKEGYRGADGEFVPYFERFFIYRLGEVTKLPYERWPVEWKDHSDVIGIGFHSYSNKKVLRKLIGISHVKCIIPEGAHYFYNPDYREYVSDQIVVQEFIY